jgi:predicted component of type VI protein secretion system
VTDETAIYLRVRGEIVRVNGRSAVFGRSRNCDVQIDEQGVSRRHCEVLLRDDGVSVRDLGSSHGTHVAGVRTEGETRLPAGTIVTLGAKGPHFEVVNAIVHGRPVLGPAPPPREASPVAAAPSSAAATSRFLPGLVTGLVVGLIAGVAVAALVDLPF